MDEEKQSPRSPGRAPRGDVVSKQWSNLERPLGCNYEGHITILLQQATNIPVAGIRGTSDPYCTLQLRHNKDKSPLKVWRSRVRYATIDPVWKEKFSCPIKGGELELTVRLELYDVDIICDDNLLGCIELVIPDESYWGDTFSHTQTVEWATCKGSNREAQGDVTFTLIYEPAEIENLDLGPRTRTNLVPTWEDNFLMNARQAFQRVLQETDSSVIYVSSVKKLMQELEERGGEDAILFQKTDVFAKVLDMEIGDEPINFQRFLKLLGKWKAHLTHEFEQKKLFQELLDKKRAGTITPEEEEELAYIRHCFAYNRSLMALIGEEQDDLMTKLEEEEDAIVVSLPPPVTTTTSISTAVVLSTSSSPTPSPEPSSTSSSSEEIVLPPQASSSSSSSTPTPTSSSTSSSPTPSPEPSSTSSSSEEIVSPPEPSSSSSEEVVVVVKEPVVVSPPPPKEASHVVVPVRESSSSSSSSSEEDQSPMAALAMSVGITVMVILVI